MSEQSLTKQLRDTLHRIERDIEQLVMERHRIIEAAIAECNHPIEHVCELSYLESSGKPWLICQLCGLTEQGWYCGYNLLKHADDHRRAKIGYSAWLDTRTKSIFQNGQIIFR